MGNLVKIGMTFSECAIVTWAALSLMAVPAIAADGPKRPYEIGPPPAWVDVAGLDAAAAQQPGAPGESEAFLLVDNQVNVATDESYHRIVVKVLNESGVQENGRQEFGFDPAYERLTIHHVRIRRGGEVINQLETQPIQVIQQEKDLEWHLYNGRLSAVLFLADLRVGDVVERASTLRGSNPVLEGRFADSFLVRWGKPVQRQRLMLRCPKERRLFVKCQNGAPEPVVSDAGAFRVYGWDLARLPAVLPDGDLPGWYSAYPFVRVSEFATWADFAKWACRLYSKSGGLSPELHVQIAQWQQGGRAVEDQLLSALRFVQDEVRYLGIELGTGSYEPSDPSTVFKRRFGDCKDKSLLLCAMLRQMGMEADPVLVHSLRRHMVDTWHPSPNAFNHVIVRAKLGGKDWWLDPTRSHERGRLQELSPPDFRRGLVVHPGTTGLTVLPSPDPARSPVEVRECYRVPGYDGRAQLQVITAARNREADRFRAMLADNNREELSKSYLNYYARTFAQIKSTHPLRVDDDPVSNRIEIVERYEIADFWKLSEDKTLYSRELSPSGLAGFLEKPATPLRSMPLAVAHPVCRRCVMEVELPERYSVKEENEVVEDKAFRLTFRSSSSNQCVRLDYAYETCGDAVPAADAADHIRLLDRARGLTSYQFTHNVGAKQNRSEGWNVSILSLAGISALFMTVVAIAIHRFKPARKVPPILDPQLHGLRGWLVVVAFGLVFRPCYVVHSMIQSAPSYAPGTWQALTVAGGASYHPLWGVTLIYELLGNLALLIGGLLLIVLFLQKRSTFPWVFIGFMVANVVFTGLDCVLAYSIPIAWKEAGQQGVKQLLQAAAGAAIWGSYMCVSRRVKVTFVH